MSSDIFECGGFAECGSKEDSAFLILLLLFGFCCNLFDDTLISP